MTALTRTINPNAIIARLKLVILDPKGCWSQVASENTEPLELLKSFFLPLAVLGALSSMLGMWLFGISIPMLGTMHPSLGSVISFAISQVVSSVASLFIAAFVLEKLAPQFGGSTTFAHSFSLVAHAAAPGLIAGLFGIFRALSAPLGFALGLYSLYVLYNGLSPMTKVPREKTLTFAVVAIICIISVNAIVFSISGTFYPTPAAQLAP